MQSTIDTLTDSNTSLTSEISTGKSSIATAITNKGVSTSASAAFSLIATNIGNIATGKKYYTGTMSVYGYDDSDTKTFTFTPSIIIGIGDSSNPYGGYFIFSNYFKGFFWI